MVELIVFGSYLREDASRLGDVDFALAWEDRFADGTAQFEYQRSRGRAAREARRTFSTFLRELIWPDLESRRYLTDRSGYVSLHDVEDNGDFVRSAPHRVLWRAAAT